MFPAIIVCVLQQNSNADKNVKTARMWFVVRKTAPRGDVRIIASCRIVPGGAPVRPKTTRNGIVSGASSLRKRLASVNAEEPEQKEDAILPAKFRVCMKNALKPAVLSCSRLISRLVEWTES